MPLLLRSSPALFAKGKGSIAPSGCTKLPTVLQWSERWCSPACRSQSSQASTAAPVRIEQHRQVLKFSSSALEAFTVKLKALQALYTCTNFSRPADAHGYGMSEFSQAENALQPIICLERSVGARQGVDAHLWSQGSFSAEVYPDLPIATSWGELFGSLFTRCEGTRMIYFWREINSPEVCTAVAGFKMPNLVLGK